MALTKYIPNTITSMNLLCGILGVISTLNGRPDTGFLFMIGAAAADFLDGFAARMLKSYSDLGKQLDSLSDMVSFGVLPAVMLTVLMQIYYDKGSFIVYTPLVYAVGTAFRLAKFNIDTRQSSSFIGLPCPAAAMICGSFAYLAVQVPSGIPSCLSGLCWFLPVAAAILALLMVSEIPMFAMKFGSSHPENTITAMENIKRIAFLSISAIAVIVVVILQLNWATVPLFAFVSYILVNLGFRFTYS